MSKFKHHSYFTKAKAEQSLRFPFVCFTCRKSYKYPARLGGRDCPQCRRPMDMLSRKFSAPKSRDIQQWQKVQYLVAHRYRFQSIYEETHNGAIRGKYPDTLEEAKEFVERLGSYRA